MAAAGAGEGGVRGRGGEHLGEAVLAEAVAALEEERAAVALVVAGLADGAAGDLHFFHLEERDWIGFLGRFERERI